MIKVFREAEDINKRNFRYKGFVVHWNRYEEEWDIYTKDEWEAGNGYRTAEWNTPTADEAREWIDSAHEDYRDIESVFRESEDNSDVSNLVYVKIKKITDRNSDEDLYYVYPTAGDPTLIRKMKKDLKVSDTGALNFPTDKDARRWVSSFGKDNNADVHFIESHKSNGKRVSEDTNPEDIKISNPGILEVPDGKEVDELPLSHFVALAKRKGHAAISRALGNLVRWNKKQNPSLSKWAEDMIDKLDKELDKDKKN